MKSISKLLIGLSLVLSLGLSGCKLLTAKTSSTTSSEPEIVEPSESEPSEPSEPEEPSEPTEPEEPEEPVVAKTVEDVAGDISTLLGMNLSDKGTYWGITLNFSESGVDYSNTQAEESVLYPVVATLVNYYMPEYLTVVGAKYFTSAEDFWEDGSGDTVYYAMLSVDEVGVDVISYCYNGYLLGQIAVYSTAK